MKDAHPARWWQADDNNRVKCLLCPRHCLIAPDSYGFCQVRQNRDGKLYTLNYGKPVAVNVDPIEKKPLAEFMPGSKTFSIGTFGCNLNCVFCQNWTLSRGNYQHYSRPVADCSPAQVIELAQKYHCKSIAFTYNEPTVFAEYAVEAAKLAHNVGLATVLVSNGYISPGAREELYPLINAANIDMKGFSEQFYRDLTAADLAAVLDSIAYLYRLGKHLEVTNLVIPGKNDTWLAGLGRGQS